MTPSTHKILSRFDGDRNRAVEYCERLAREYPNLYTEYKDYSQAIRATKIEDYAYET
jgi:hypothetical protein